MHVTIGHLRCDCSDSTQCTTRARKTFPSPAQVTPCAVAAQLTLHFPSRSSHTNEIFFKARRKKLSEATDCIFLPLRDALYELQQFPHLKTWGFISPNAVFPEKALEASSHFWVENTYRAHLIHEDNQLACKCRWSKHLLTIAI